MVHPRSETPLRNKKEQTTDAHNSRGDSQGRWLKEVRPQNTQSMTPIRQNQHGWHGADPDRPGLGRAPDCRGQRKLRGSGDAVYLDYGDGYPGIHTGQTSSTSTLHMGAFHLGKPHLAKVHFKILPAGRYKL